MTVEYYTFVLIVYKCVSEEANGESLYKVGYMAKNGAIYFSENIYPHIEEAVKNGTEYAKNTISTFCKNAYNQYVNSGHNNALHVDQTNKRFFPSRSVFIEGEEFVLTS